MLDTIHYYFEDDLNMSTAEQAEAKDKTRSAIYRDFYGRPYAHATGISAKGNNSQAASATIDFDEEVEMDAPIDPFSPSKQPTKPYVAPTNFDPGAAKPFGGVLDAPMG